MGRVRVGTCSWTDKTMIEAWYPPQVSSAEARLRFYAERYDTVEADSPFYAIPRPVVAENWAKRTPDGFVFHVKAFGLMTRHAVDERRLSPELRELVRDVDERGRVRHPSAELVDASFDSFNDFIEPLRVAGKLGGVLMQFPPYIAATDHARMHEHLGYIEYAAEKLGDARMLVEFRHPSWVTGEREAETMRFLSDRGLTYVSVDAPQFPDHSTMPPVTAATSDWSYVRLHGRNRETYFGRSASAADRFDYLYTAEELAEWAPRVHSLATESDTTWVMFNNCKYDYAPRNAREMAEILGDVAAPYAEGGALSDAGQLDLGV
ncbi:MAG: DUF72 domain-containing protein [Actinomycetia bacterium]|nr:DUF72 domain-containing protein [Actinomycetes bacterium]